MGHLATKAISRTKLRRANRLASLGMTLSLLLAPVGARSDFSDGVAAYKAGDFMRAAIEFQIAAEKGDALAQLNLGLLYDTGQGVEQSYEEAVGWYRKAAEKDLPLAQLNLGSMYFEGLGVKRDLASAASWYRRAAFGGLAGAQYNLSVMYEDGLGVTPDLVEAYAWRRIAARTTGTVPDEELQALQAKLTPDQIEAGEELIKTFDGSTQGETE